MIPSLLPKVVSPSPNLLPPPAVCLHLAPLPLEVGPWAVWLILVRANDVGGGDVRWYRRKSGSLSEGGGSPIRSEIRGLGR